MNSAEQIRQVYAWYVASGMGEFAELLAGLARPSQAVLVSLGYNFDDLQA